MQSAAWLKKSQRYSLKLPEALPGINIRRDWPTVDRFCGRRQLSAHRSIGWRIH